MVFLGSALMVFNIYGFIRFARYVKGLKSWKQCDSILYVPIVLLVLFLLGYLGVGIFGKPDLLVAGILFGGSIFVCVMYFLLNGITQRILESEKLETKLMATEESNRAKASFLAGISHEMRTPMNVILGLSSLELKNTALTPESRAHIEKVEQSARYLLGLINNILDMNRLTGGTMTLKNEEFSLSEALQQVNSVVQTLCDNNGLTYEFTQQPNSNGRYYSDTMLLKQVWMSVLDNAVKFSRENGMVRFSVETASESEGVRTLRFIVADNGVGIDPEFLPRIYEMFSQEDQSATSQFGGSGLSLAVTKRILELMGGWIEVESEKNKGSVFTITIPLHYVADDVDIATAEDLASVSLAGKRILLAEDIPENAEIVMDLLELEGVETERAENGKIALEMFSSSDSWYYDAVLMDLRMPVMDGLEATRQIRALQRPDAKDIPIIALTANAFDTDVKASLNAGMNFHLAKPADAETLYDTLKRMILQSHGEGRRGHT